MKKTIFTTIILSAFFLAGCMANTSSTVNQDSETSGENPTITTEQEGTANNTDEMTKEAEEGFPIPEVGIAITLPEEYMITKSNEENRRGSFASYEFSGDTPPSFQEIQFFSEESIKKFTADCGDTPCFFGDYPDLARYNGQKNAFSKMESYENYELKKFGDRNYFVSNFKCSGDSCVIREYTTFINDTKIDVWITMENDNQANAADTLFNEFKITE